MRLILHSDLNCFYASVEMLYDPSLKNRPMAVAGDPQARHGIILAKNELAKKAGVQTAETIWQARRKCPELVLVGARHGLYEKYSQKVRAIYRQYTRYVEPFGLDEAWLDVTGLGFEAISLADELRRRVREEMGLTLSVGVSFNKVFAKLGSDLKKPDATTIISPQNYRKLVWPLPVRNLLFVGPSTERKLRSRNIHTIGDLALCSPEILRSALGKCGESLWIFANGLENQPVVASENAEEAKSVGNSVTPSHDLHSEEEVKSLLFALSESVGERLKRQGQAARVVGLSIRDCDLISCQCQTQLPQPTWLSAEIADAAVRLFRERWHWDKPVRSLGVSGLMLRSCEGWEQIPLFPDLRRERQKALEEAVLSLRHRFGVSSICRATTLLQGFSEIDLRQGHRTFPSKGD